MAIGVKGPARGRLASGGNPRSVREPRLPAIPLSLARAAVPGKRSAGPATQLPGVVREIIGYRVPDERLARFRNMMGTDSRMPITFPALLATALHLDLVSAWSFPIRVVGLVHPGFVVESVAALAPDQPWDIRAWVDGHRHVRSGLEFDLRAEVVVAGQVRWRCRAVTLAKSSRASGPQASATPRAHLPEAWHDEAPMVVPADAGRRFGRFSGDMNLIHLHPVTARLFGLDRPIAHGWWLAGRIAAQLGLAEAAPGRAVRIAFRRPIPLPSTPQLCWSDGPADVTFALVLPGADRPAVTGVITS